MWILLSPETRDTLISNPIDISTKGDRSEKSEVDLAIDYHTKPLEMIPKDPREDLDFLENLRKGAAENLERLEQRKSRQKK